MVMIGGTLPNDTYGFTYKGLHSGRDFDMWLTKSPIDFLPEARDNYEEVPEMDGVHDFGASLGPRDIQMELVIRAQSEAELKNKRRAISSWMHPGKGEGELWWDTEPDKFYNARRFGSQTDLTQQARQGKFSLAMRASDPHAFKRNESPAEILSTGSHTVVNAGTEPSFPLLELEGTGSGSITISAGGTALIYKGATNGKVILDSKDMTAYKGDENMMPNVEGNFFTLAVGNNELQVTTNGFSLSSLVVKPRSRWI